MRHPNLVSRAGAVLCLPILIAAFAASAPAQVPTVQEKTRDLERRDGFFPFYWNEKEGTLLLEVPGNRINQDFLYLTSLSTGIGSLELGLDRGTIGDERVVRFERAGPKLLLIQQNTGFRALDTENDMLVLSVRESFPTSVLGAFQIIAEERGRVLIDATEFFLRDAMDVRGTISRGEQGEFSVDSDRSTVYLTRTKAFPKNTEIEAMLTFVSERPGPEIRRHAPDGRSLTLREHHSLVELPRQGYRPRPLDPRVGLFGLPFYDFSQPLTQQYPQRWIIRWRLEKKDLGASRSEPKQPIVYYMDRGIPEPYRSAFREGAMWFNSLFEAAGFVNAFEVRDLPEGADPMDARYSVIQWIHRTEPGFSIGPSFVDPRTGEIIKAAVRMDSYRSLVDFNLWAGATPSKVGMGDRWDYCELATADGLPEWVVELDPNTDPVEFAMARRRQHAAHEVGHTLGLAHNFVPSTYGRASVMDYPPPRMLIDKGRIDLSEAYRPGPGAYDSLAIRFGYTQFAPDEEEGGLAKIIQEGINQGLVFITDVHARPSGASDPRATLWDDGSESVAAFRHSLAVREILLANFDERAIEPGEPMALLRDRLAAVYLHHRYELDAAVRTVGGMEFTYALRGDGQAPTRIIEPARQRAALEVLLDGLEPDALVIRESVLEMMAPYPFGYSAPRRGFQSAAQPAFDQLGAARTLSTMIVGGLLQPERATRLVSFPARQPNALSLDEVISKLIERTWMGQAPTTASAAAVQRVTQRVVVDELIDLAGNADVPVEVRAMAEWHLERLTEAIAGRSAGEANVAAHNVLAVRDIRRFLNRVDDPAIRSQPLPPAPGTPIGER